MELFRLFMMMYCTFCLGTLTKVYVPMTVLLVGFIVLVVVYIFAERRKHNEQQ